MKCNLPSVLSISSKALSLSILGLVLVGGNLSQGAIAAESGSPTIVAQTLTVQAKAEQFIDALATDDIAGAREFLNPQIKKDWSEAMMRQSWQDLLAVTGAFQQRLSSQVDGEVVLVTIQFETTTNDAIVIFDQSGQITGYDFPKMEGQ